MDPFAVNVLDSIEMEAAGIIPFGAAVIRSAAGTITATLTADDHDILGFADAAELEKDVPGFYATYDTIRVVTAGRFNAWVVANGSDVNIAAGDFLDVADLGSSPTGTHGILEECGSAAGGTKLISSRAQAVEDVTMGSDSYQVPDAVSIGDETVTFTAAELTSLNVSDGDYILLEDLTDNLQVNRVKSQTSTVITLEKASTVALDGSTDLVTKMFQCEVMII